MDLNKVRAGLVGVAVGDALGVPVETKSRAELAENPVQGMEQRQNNLPAGTWSDDSALTFCLAESLCRGYNLQDISNRFVRWYEEGYWSTLRRRLGIGETTKQAIENLRSGIAPLEAGGRGEYDNGNGSLMRILPLAYFLLEKQPQERFKRIHEVSSLTHGHPRAKLACGIYVEFAINLLKGLDLAAAYTEMQPTIKNYFQSNEYYPELSHFSRILEVNIAEVPRNKIKASAYVVETLEAGLWALLTSDSFSSAVLSAVNLGEDADTVGAVTGGLAGIYYGWEAIPEEWKQKLVHNKHILDLAGRFHQQVVAD